MNEDKYYIDDYGAFSEIVDDWCSKLQLYRNQKLVVSVEKSKNLYAIMCACLKLRITFILVDSCLPDERKKNIIAESDANGLIDDSYAIKPLRDSENRINNIAYMIFTSGTTGKPKGILITYDNLKEFVCSISERINFKNKTIISFTSVSFDIFILESVVAMYNHMKIVILEDQYRRNPKKIIETILSAHVDFIQCTPSSMRMLINYSSLFLNSIKTLLLGGEHLEYDLLKQIKASYEGELYNMYGPSETTVWVTHKIIGSEINIGKPFSRNTDILIVDKENRLLSPGEFGEIVITGSLVGAGYYHNDTLTASKFKIIDGKPCFYSGDYGKMDENGDLIIWGRMDDQIKINGHRIEKSEIKEELIQIPDVEAAEIYYNSIQKQLIAYYVGKKHENHYLIDFLKKRLPDYMIPGKFVNIPDFYYNNNGKLDIEQTNMKYAENCDENHIDDDILVLVSLINSIGLGHIDHAAGEDLLSEHGVDSITMISILVELASQYMIDIDVCVESIGTIKTLRDLKQIMDAGLNPKDH
jgi:acyl-CoA synthetase (AMP-forming)/AMP-acid ligase II